MNKNRTRGLLPTILLLSFSSIAGAQTVAPASSCRSVGGLASIGTTDDDGGTWATSKRPMRLGEGTFGLATVGTGAILAEYRGRIYTSANGGCNWRPVGSISGTPLRLVGGANGAYAWNFFSTPEVWRIDLGARGASKVQQVSGLPDDVIAIGVDPTNDLHARALGRKGGLYETFDGGASKWGTIATVAVTPIVYFAEFDPNDLDHMVVGMLSNGVATTFDGGATWTVASGLTQTGGSRNSFSGAISPANGTTVWVESVDLDESRAGVPSGGKHIYASLDGGLSFVPVVDAGNGVTLQNGAPLVADPGDEQVLYFPLGLSVFGNLLQLFRYDLGTGQLTSTTTTTTPHAKARALVMPALFPGRVVAGFEG
jgi:hypothetical protein